MKKVKFYFKLTSKGKLQNVQFFPEDSQAGIQVKPDTSKKEWKNEGFVVEVTNPFQYELSVEGASETEWDAELKIIDGDAKKEFLSWSGTTGDTNENLSIRTKPEKNVD